MTLRQLVWQAQGARSLVVAAAYWPNSEASADQLNGYIEDGTIGDASSEAMPYDPVVYEGMTKDLKWS